MGRGSARRRGPSPRRRARRRRRSLRRPSSAGGGGRSRASRSARRALELGHVFSAASRSAAARLAAVGREVADQLVHLGLRDVARFQGRTDMGRDWDRRFAHTYARDGDEPTVGAVQSGPLPHVTEHEVQDAGVLVRRVPPRSGNEVHVRELLFPATQPCLPVVVSELLRRPHRQRLRLVTPSCCTRAHACRTYISRFEAFGQPQYTAKCRSTSRSSSTVRSPLFNAAYTCSRIGSPTILRGYLPCPSI